MKFIKKKNPLSQKKKKNIFFIKYLRFFWNKQKIF